MKYLNLSEGFNPDNAKEVDCIEYELLKFSGGEPHIKIKSFWNPEENITISCRINSPDDLFALILAFDALIRVGNINFIHLIIPYFPGARQDRVMVKGEPLTVKIYADLINSLDYNSLTILDPHSDVTSALLKNLHVINNHEFIREVLADISDNDGRYNPIIISPDAGSNKKIKDLAKYLHDLDGDTEITVVKCDKSRNTSTGEITGFEVYSNDLEGKDCIIVDDICANGGTFMGLAKELKAKNAGNIHLVITHGEFGANRYETIRRLTTVFKTIYFTDSIFTLDDNWFETAHHYHGLEIRDKFKQIKIKDIL